MEFLMLETFHVQDHYVRNSYAFEHSCFLMRKTFCIRIFVFENNNISNIWDFLCWKLCLFNLVILESVPFSKIRNSLSSKLLRSDSLF